MTKDTTLNSAASPAVEPLTWFTQGGTTVTLLPNDADEYDVQVTTGGGGDLRLSWFEAVLLGKAIGTAGDVVGRVNTASTVQLHVEQWTTWLAQQLGVDEDAPARG